MVSAIVLTLNEQANLPDCLASLAGLDCEIFVVDSGSTDRTVAIAQAAGASVFHHGFENYSAQRNWAQDNLPLQSEWVLHLDADERLTGELAEEINRTLRQPDPEVQGYLFRKRTIFMGRWMRHGGHYPSYHLRLFRRGKGRSEDRLYDQHFLVDGQVERLHHDYLDIVASDIRTWTMRHVRWAELEARQTLAEPTALGTVVPRAFGTPIERKRWLREKVYGRAPWLLRPFLYWGYRYFVRLGFLDGMEGFLFHFLQGWWFRLLVDCRLRELRSLVPAVGGRTT
jgi:glycosyltransferase involved in cell wall biosynthesis